MVPVKRWHIVLYRNVYHFVVAYMWRKLWTYFHSYLNSPRSFLQIAKPNIATGRIRNTHQMEPIWSALDSENRTNSWFIVITFFIHVLGLGYVKDRARNTYLVSVSTVCLQKFLRFGYKWKIAPNNTKNRDGLVLLIRVGKSILLKLVKYGN